MRDQTQSREREDRWRRDRFRTIYQLRVSPSLNIQARRIDAAAADFAEHALRFVKPPIGEIESDPVDAESTRGRK